MDIRGLLNKTVRLPYWALAALVVLVVAAIGLWGNAKWALAKWQDDDAQKVAQVASLTSDLADVTKDRDQAREGLDQAQSALTKAQDALEPQQELAAKENALQSRESAVRASEDALAQREADVKAREDAVTVTEQQVADNTIRQGTWTVGTDIAPGTYRTTEAVSGMCYWEITRSGTNGDDIVANDIVTGGHPPREWYYTDDHYDSFRRIEVSP